MKIISQPFGLAINAPNQPPPSNAPNIWELDFTGEAAIQARKGTLLVPNYPGNPEFLLDAAHNNMPFMRFTNNPNAIDGGYAGGGNDGATIISWFLSLGGEYDTVHTRYCLWIEDDVEAGFNELGMKLPGPTNEPGNGETDLVSWRTWHAPPVNNTYALNNYRYDAETGNGWPIPDAFQTPVVMKTNRWYVIEIGVKLNTPGQADGWGAMWVNDTKVLELNNHTFRNDPLTKLRSFHFNVYHGGMTNPKGIMHYRVAKAGASTSYMGIPSELVMESL